MQLLIQLLSSCWLNTTIIWCQLAAISQIFKVWLFTIVRELCNKQHLQAPTPLPLLHLFGCKQSSLSRYVTQVSYTSGPMPLHYAPPQSVMTFVPTPQPAQQPLGGAPSQSGGPAGSAQHQVMMAQPAAQQHSLHTAVPPQMIIPSQPQPGIQAPPVGGHQYVQAHAIPGNLFTLCITCFLT